MNPAIHHYSVTQQQAQIARESCRHRHHVGDLPLRERRLSGYGARVLALFGRRQRVPALRPVRGN